MNAEELQELVPEDQYKVGVFNYKSELRVEVCDLKTGEARWFSVDPSEDDLDRILKEGVKRSEKVLKIRSKDMSAEIDNRTRSIVDAFSVHVEHHLAQPEQISPEVVRAPGPKDAVRDPVRDLPIYQRGISGEGTGDDNAYRPIEGCADGAEEG